MSTQEQMISMVKDMTAEERRELLKELYSRGFIFESRFRELLNIDEEKFQASVAEYDRDSAMAAIDEVSEEFILDMILENE